MCSLIVELIINISFIYPNDSHDYFGGAIYIVNRRDYAELLLKRQDIAVQLKVFL